MPANITSAISSSSTTAVPMVLSGPRTCRAAMSDEADWAGWLKSAMGAVGGSIPGGMGAGGSAARAAAASGSTATTRNSARSRGMAESVTAGPGAALAARGHHTRRRLAVEIREDRFGGLPEEDPVALGSHEAQVRRQHDVVEAEERVAIRQRLDVEHVQRGAGDAARAQRVQQRLLVHDRLARGVDEERARFHEGQVARGDEPARLVRQPVVHADDVALAQQRV